MLSLVEMSQDELSRVELRLGTGSSRPNTCSMTDQGPDAFVRHLTYDTVFNDGAQESFLINSLWFYYCIANHFGRKKQRQMRSMGPTEPRKQAGREREREI